MPALDVYGADRVVSRGFEIGTSIERLARCIQRCAPDAGPISDKDALRLAIELRKLRRGALPIVTRAEARMYGLPRYIGRPCAQGHVERATRSRACVACDRERQRRERRAPNVAASLAKARATGAKRYRGRPCAQGHVERFAANHVCVECDRERRRQERSAQSRQKQTAMLAGLSLHILRDAGPAGLSAKQLMSRLEVILNQALAELVNDDKVTEVDDFYAATNT